MIKNIILKHNHTLIRHFIKEKSYFISTPIYYANDKPHIGHFYTNCLADVITKWNRLKGSKVLFSTGTDDHGFKIQRSAEKLNLTPKQLADKSSKNFKTLFDLSGISYSDFIRTSDDKHKVTVSKVWEKLMARGCFTKQKYSGWYSVTEECFISNTTISTETSQNHYDWCEEENWMFDISLYKSRIREWANSGAIHPKNFLTSVNEAIDELNLVSVSRPSQRVKWGVAVPNDPGQTIYVWFDALINYLTVSQSQMEDNWPADLQIIGKDITRFHTVLWPSILLALDLELPRKILIHSHWLKNDIKMSKSLGNISDPLQEAELLGGYEQLKYFLLSENALERDCIYDTNRAIVKINNHLVNVTGNLLSRITSLKINPLQKIGVDLDITDDLFSGNSFNKLLSGLTNLVFNFENHMDHLDIHLAIESVINVLRLTNVFFDSQKPWESFGDSRKRDAVIYVASESLRMSGILFQCFVPKLADKILDRISVPGEKRTLAEVHFKHGDQKNVRLLNDANGSSILMNRLSKDRL